MESLSNTGKYLETKKNEWSVCVCVCGGGGGGGGIIGDVDVDIDNFDLNGTLFP